MKDSFVHVTGGECFFSVNLRRLRLMRQPRLSQERLAKRLGVCRSTYAKYEQGERMPPAWFVFSTANYFGVAIDDLFQKSMTTYETNGKGEKIKNESIAYRHAKED